MIKTALSKFFRKQENILFVGNPNNWPNIYVHKNNNNKYNLYVINGRKTLEKTIEKINVSQAKVIVDELKKNNAYVDFNKEPLSIELSWSNVYAKRDVVGNIARGIHRIIHRASDVGKDIDFSGLNNVSKLAFKNIFLNMTKEKMYHYFLAKQKMHPTDFIELFGEISLENVEDVDNFKYKKWDIELFKGVKIDKEKIIQLLDLVESKLSSKGFSNLCYGKVVFVRTMTGRTLADYLHTSDLMRIKTFKRLDNEMIKTIIHELGHRLYYKFGIDKRKVYNEFFDSKMKEDGTFKMIKGERVKINKVEFVVEEDLRDSFIAKPFQLDKEDLSKFQTTFKIKKVPEIEFLDREVKIEKNYFPTSYSETKDTEWFAELFAFYVLGKLKEPALSLFRSLI